MPKGFREIAAELRTAVEAGTYPPGAKLPTEHELADRYGVSRETVSRALRELKAEGVVTSATSLGTFVPHPPVILDVARYTANIGPDGPVTELGPWETACRNAGVAGRTEMLDVTREPATPGLAVRLQIDPGTVLVRRARRMWADDVPYQLQDAWMPLHLIDGTPLAAPGKITVGVYPAMVAAGLTLDYAIESVSSRTASASERKLLHLKAALPVTEIWRTTHEPDDRPVEALRVVGVGRMNVHTYRLPLRTQEEGNQGVESGADPRRA